MDCVKSSTNSWSRGFMFRGVGLVKLSSVMGHSKNIETYLFKLSSLTIACPIIGWVDLGARDVRK